MWNTVGRPPLPVHQHHCPIRHAKKYNNRYSLLPSVVLGHPSRLPVTLPRKSDTDKRWLALGNMSCSTSLQQHKMNSYPWAQIVQLLN